MRRKSSVLSKFLSALLASAALCGCQTAQQQAEDPIAWSRLDCKRLADGPEMVPQFEQAKLICVNRAEAAGVAGTAGMPVGHGVGGAIAAGISQGIASAQIQTATAKSAWPSMATCCKGQANLRLGVRERRHPSLSAPSACDDPQLIVGQRNHAPSDIAGDHPQRSACSMRHLERLLGVLYFTFAS